MAFNRVCNVAFLPVLSKFCILLGNRIGDPGQSLEEDVMLSLVVITLAGFSTCQELLLLIVKVISEHISVEVQHVDVIRIFLQVLQGFEETNMLIIKSDILK